MYYTCQLSRLRGESHACGLKTSISRRLTLADQFLTPDRKMWVVAIAWYNFQKYVNSDPCKEGKPCVKWINDNTFLAISEFWSEITGSELAFKRVLRLGLDNLAFGRLRTSSEDFGLLRNTSDFFGNFRKWSCGLQKSQHSQDKNLTFISQKKLAGIMYMNSNK